MNPAPPLPADAFWPHAQAVDGIDILALTFDEAASTISARQHQLFALRKQYAAVIRGEAERSGPFVATLYSAAREVQDGELRKFILRTPDGLETESVVIPMARHGKQWKTLCVSSQVGCAMGCTFCETAQMGLLRNLTAAEIVMQVVAARRVFGEPVQNVVFMGMGEPMENFDNVAQAIRVLSDPTGLAIRKERITVSTVGRIEGIRRLRALGWRRLNLAVSLNAPNDDIRRLIMPINRAEPMAALREALIAYPQRANQHLMIEYVVIPGINDRPEHARELAEFCRPIRCSVNVIPYNPRRASPWPAPTEESVQAFMSELTAAGQFCKRRYTHGRDLMAACGQLGNRSISRDALRQAGRLPLLRTPGGTSA